ncbi:MAG: WhiB family transcriptional regulator [Acidimicrobiales bacterium]|jgi:hypothetical protein
MSAILSCRHAAAWDMNTCSSQAGRATAQASVAERGDSTTQAKALCWRCDVVAECLEYALAQTRFIRQRTAGHVGKSVPPCSC